MKKIILTSLVLACAFFFNVSFAQSSTSADQAKLTIVKTAKSMGVDPLVALSIARTESNFNHNRQNPSGAVGMFQLMPSTARRIGVNPYDMADNIRGGIKYYQMMYKMFGTQDLALAAYNAGPGNVKKYGGIPPFGETRAFVKNIRLHQETFRKDPYIQQIMANPL